MNIQPTERGTNDRRRIGEFDRRAQRRDYGPDRRSATGPRLPRPATQERVESGVLHDAAALGFSKRRPGGGIVWGSPLTPEERRLGERSVGKAADVTLHHLFETVLVRNIRPGAAGDWVGTVQGFERSGGPYRGIQVGDDILFREENVFSAGD